MAKTLYDILGVTATVSADDVTLRADAMLAQLRGNPNLHDAANQEKFVTYAREVLTDSVKRARYDQSLRDREMANSQVRAVLERTVEAQHASASSSSRPLPTLWLSIGLFAVAIAAFAGYNLAQSRAKASVASTGNAASASEQSAKNGTASSATTPASTTALKAAGANVESAAANDATPASASATSATNASTGTLVVPVAELSAADIFKMNQASIVVVRGMIDGGRGVSQGSGVVIGDEAVITNCHVARAASDISVRLAGQVLSARVNYRDQGHDLCQLAVPGLKANAVATASVATLAVGTKVYAIGAPQGLELSLSDGVVASLRPLGGSSLIQTTAAISAGSSGGGLFDSLGRLVGITTFQSRTGQNLNFAVPADWINLLPQRDGNTDSLLPERP
jgi:serine protease Do